MPVIFQTFFADELTNLFSINDNSETIMRILRVGFLEKNFCKIANSDESLFIYLHRWVTST